ncbi:MAG: uracil-DNA glycosylase family protein [Myxococcota bacterium]
MARRSLKVLLDDIADCTICAPDIDPRPVVQVGSRARIVIIGQAPGRKVHESGVPWDDVSGKRLRKWLGVSDEAFYDRQQFALIPMGFCFPGSGKSGDLPPRLECAPAWHKPLLASLRQLKLTLLLGQYAQQHYLAREGTVTEQVRQWKKDLRKGLLALPHPSPRSRWTRQHPWFEEEVVPAAQRRVRQALR